MPGKQKTKDQLFQHLDSFIKQNDTTDFRTADLSAASASDSFNWKGLKKYTEKILTQLKSYRRLLRVMPEGTEHKIIMALLQDDIHSALQLAAMPRHRFIAAYLPVFGEDQEYIESFYLHATAIRARILLQYMNKLQNNEPHIASTKI